MLETLNHWDHSLFDLLNGTSPHWVNVVMTVASTRLPWTPLYALLLYLLVKRLGWKQALVAALLVAPLILLADQASSDILKPWVHRLRPCHELQWPQVVLPGPQCPPGKYGFVSSHAANMTALVVYLGLCLGSLRWWQWLLLLLPALLVGYSRVHLGVHFPGDVLGGFGVGLLAALVIHLVRRWLFGRLGLHPQR